MGSGFIVSPDGLILTTAHVVDQADEVTVRLTDRREFKAKVVAVDPQAETAQSFRAIADKLAALGPARVYRRELSLR